MASSPSSFPSQSPQETQNKLQFPPTFFNPTNLAIPTAPKKAQPLPWTHQETINLIQSYQEKWYSLKKGQLKSSQWEEVSVTVAARCGYDEPSKSATQCRHKIEKLRKRYRAERLKPYPDSWPYFDLMDRMECGPLPITMARPMSMVQPTDDDDDDDDSDDSDLDYNSNKSRSINHIVKGPYTTTTSSSVANVETSDRAFGVSRKPIIGKRKELFEIDDDVDEDEEVDEEENDDQGGEGNRVATELAAQIRAFADKFVKVEHQKIQMMRETAKHRMEMENKKMEMIIESQRKLVDTIHKAFSTSHKKVKTAH